MNDEKYMRRAMALGQKGCGRVSPNPLVGAVIVKDGRVIGEGYHAKYGDLHAERDALRNCTVNPVGASMYVTLEPCCHHGKQPPCTEAIIRSGIKEVIIGSDDPNPVVAGKGIEELKSNGVNVKTGVLKDECDKQNEVFLHFIKTGRPFVILKYAMTMDGKIASPIGDSKWVTGEDARRRVHEDRNRYSSIMVGIRTVLSDDPLLTSRISESKNPIRVILDTSLKTPEDCQIVKTADTVDTVLMTCSSEIDKIEKYQKLGCKVVIVPRKNGKVDLGKAIEKLGEMRIDSVYIEGGSTLNWSALESNMINKVHTYIAPKLIGGTDSKTPIAGEGFEKMKNALVLSNTTVNKLGPDILIESEVL